MIFKFTGSISSIKLQSHGILQGSKWHFCLVTRHGIGRQLTNVDCTLSHENLWSCFQMLPKIYHTLNLTWQSCTKLKRCSNLTSCSFASACTCIYKVQRSAQAKNLFIQTHFLSSSTLYKCGWFVVTLQILLKTDWSSKAQPTIFAAGKR